MRLPCGVKKLETLIKNKEMIIWIFLIATMIVSYAISKSLQNKFEKYSKIPVVNNLTGAQVAEKMLRDSGIYDVQVTCIDGKLTDHYNPKDATVNLSKDVYYGTGISAAAVAAHECGHAIQHDQAYEWLGMRTALVPVVEFSSRIVQWVLLAGVLLFQTFPMLLLAGIILFSFTTLFSFVTLPVEINASKRALLWLSTSGIATEATYPKAKDALKTAAYTYVVAAVSSLGTLLYYIWIYMGRRD